MSFLEQPDWRSDRVLTLTTLAFLATLFLTLKLWSGVREFPFVPVWGGVPGFPAFLASGVLVFVMWALGVQSFMRFRIWLVAPVLATVAIWVLQDITRLQPWLYMYGFTLLALCFKAPHALRIMIIGAYIWSGISKLNAQFYLDVFPWFIRPFFPDPFSQDILLSLALPVPVFEILIGICLFFRPSRGFGIFLSFAMMVFILACLGPFGHFWNPSVWPWNIWLFLVTLVLFFRDETAVRDLCRPQSFMHGLAGILFLVMPGLNYAGLWDNYLSFQLYSGRIPLGQIHVAKEDVENLPPAAQQSAAEGRVPVLIWSFRALGVPPYPEPRVFHQIAQNLCPVLEAPDSLRLDVLFPLSGDTRTSHPCRR